MREDILEQLVDDYLQSQGYFTRHNLKFRPDKSHRHFDPRQDSNHSDIDVLGYHPKRSGTKRVMVVSCKSWQGGFRVAAKLQELTLNRRVSGRESWRYFRELMSPKWSEAYIQAVTDATGSSKFTYVLALTAVKGDRSQWELHEPFRKALGGNPIQILTLSDMLKTLLPSISTTVAASSLGRTLQLLKASGFSLDAALSPPTRRTNNV